MQADARPSEGFVPARLSLVPKIAEQIDHRYWAQKPWVTKR
jgi:hypothetical protein